MFRNKYLSSLALMLCSQASILFFNFFLSANEPTSRPIIHTILITDSEPNCRESLIHDEIFCENLFALMRTGGCKVRKAFHSKHKKLKRKHLIRAIDALKIKPRDTIFFYYAGHGTRTPKNASPWPELCAFKKKLFPTRSIIKALKAKKPRFLFVMTDCCNGSRVFPLRYAYHFQAQGHPFVINYLEDKFHIAAKESLGSNIKQLFLKSKGHVFLTAAKPGFVCVHFDRIGSSLTKSFKTALEFYAITRQNPSWDAVLHLTHRIAKEHFNHNPLYKAKLKDSPPHMRKLQKKASFTERDYSLKPA